MTNLAQTKVGFWAGAELDNILADNRFIIGCKNSNKRLTHITVKLDIETDIKGYLVVYQ